MEENIIERFAQTGIIPVAVIEDAQDAEMLGKALCRGGLKVIEVTFRTEAAPEAIGILRKTCPDLVTGAGTILNRDQADTAVKAGAQFIVSPGLDVGTVEYCLENQITVCPGVMTPSEIMTAVNLGLDHVKFFPAEKAGGTAMIRTLASVFRKVKFMPTGGINIHNVRDYLREPSVFCAGGTWMVKKELIQEKKFETIARMVKEAADIVKEERGC